MPRGKAQGPTAAKAQDRDPTVVGIRGDVPEYPEGTHPPVKVSDQTWSGDRFNYGDLDDDLKPDPSTVANTVEDPLQDDVDKALADQADDRQTAASNPPESDK